MDSTVFLVALVAFSVMATQLLPRLTGTTVRVGAAGHFILGVLVGPQVFGLLSQSSVDRLQPLLSLLIGLLGFGLGLEARGRAGPLAKLPPRLIHSLILATTIGAGAYFALLLLTGGMVDQTQLLWAAATIGVMGSASSWHRIVEISRSLRAQGPVTDTLLAYSMTSLGVAVLLFGAISAGMRSDVAAEGLLQLTTLEWLVAIGGVGFTCGVLFVAFIGDEESPSRVFLATVGTVIFATGMAAALGISALLVGLVVGATVGAFSSHAQALQRVIGRLYFPSYVLLLILVGAVWQPPPALLWLLVPLYLALRGVALRFAPVAAFAAAEEPLPTRRFGAGLAAQGAFALAIATNYLQLRPADGSMLITVAVAAILLEDLLADRWLRQVLGDAQEVFVAPEEVESDEEEPAHEDIREHSHGAQPVS